MGHDSIADLRQGFRQFVRAPALTAVAVLTLAIGIGATAAIFSLLDAATLQRLPVPHAEQLRTVVVISPSGESMANVPSVFFDELRSASSFSGVFAFWRTTMNIDTGGDVERIPVQLVSGGYYSTLGVDPSAGRLIDASDEKDRRQVAVISHAFWLRWFSGAPSAIGRTLNVNGTATTVIGITSAAFFGTDRGISPDVTIPLTSAPRLSNVWVTARLKPDVSDERARAEADLVLRRALDIIRPSLNDYRPRDRDAILGERAGLIPGDKGLGSAMSAYVDPLRLLMLLAGVVLLVACVNIANLLLARSIGRSREIGLRLALGASRGRLIRQLLVENAMLAVTGLVAGITVAFWMHRALVRLLMDEAAAQALTFAIDTHVLVFSAAILVITLLIFGIAPAIRATAVHGRSLLQRAAPVSRGSRLGPLKIMVVVQVASAVLLLFCAGLLTRTLYNLTSLGTGVPARNLIMMRLGLGQRGYQAFQAVSLYDQIAARVEPLPGVESLAFGWDYAFASGTAGKSLWVEGQPPERSQSAGFNVVGPGFFATAQVPLVAGREFSRGDAVGAPLVVIINDAFARRYFPDQNPIGRHVGDDGARSVMKYEVVGVVTDTRNMLLRRAAGPMIYQPLLQDTWASNAVLHVRAHGDARGLQDRIRAEVRALDPKLPVYDMTTLDARLSLALQRDRMMAALSGFFGGLALLLTAIGVYGVIAFAVGRRTVEIGVRMALGATRAGVRWMVVRETLALMAAGAAVGVPVAVVGARVLNTSLFGVTAADPWTAGACALVLLAVGGLAGYLPARRAAGLEPMAALRAE